MSQTFGFYNARANEAAAEADAATLDNVRERNLRAAKTWRGLADQARKVMTDRVTSERERAERRSAEETELAVGEAREQRNALEECLVFVLCHAHLGDRVRPPRDAVLRDCDNSASPGMSLDRIGKGNR